MRCCLAVCALLAVACGPDEIPSTLAIGGGSHDLETVDLRTIATAEDGLATPRDVALHPERDELWVVNRDDDSAVVITAPDSGEQSAEHFNSFGSKHFLANPSGIAFGEDGYFATVHEEDEKTQGFNGTPEDFMGPTLWDSDPDIFDGGHAGHMDMLHNSPNGVGIAWEVGNAYWVVDGWNNSLTRYDFHDDHGAGGADHSDGEIVRYVEGEIGYLEEVSSHAVYDHAADYLYVADAANGRIVTLDCLSGEEGGSIGPNYDGIGAMYAMDDADLWTLVDDGAFADSDAPVLQTPSGLALSGDLLFTTDHATGVIYAFDLQGTLIDWLDTGLGEGLQGLRVDNEGNLWVAHASANEIIKLSPAEE